MSNKDFEGKNAIVTGGATGIGESTARILADRGATVTIFDINQEGAERVSSSINENDIDNHIKNIEQENQVTDKHSRMQELKNWLQYLNEN